MKRLQFYDAYLENEFLWAIPNGTCFLFKMNWNTGVVEEAYPLPEGMKAVSYKKVVRFRDYLLFFPLRGKTILEFSLITCDFCSILTDQYMRKAEISKICTGDVLIWHEKFVVIPLDLGMPLMILGRNGADWNVRLIRQWNEKVKEMLNGFFYRTTISAIVGDVLYTPLVNTSMIAVMNLNNLEMTVVCPEMEDNQIFSITQHEEEIYITTMESSDIFSWNPSDGAVERYSPAEKMKSAGAFYYMMIPWHSEIFILPYQSLFPIQRLDCTKKKMEVYADYPVGFRASCGEGTIFYGYGFDGNTLLLYPLRGNHLLRIDINYHAVCSINIETPWSLVKKLFGNSFYNQGFDYLQDFIDDIRNHT